MPGIPKQPDKEYKPGWGGRRVKDGQVLNGAPGKARPSRRKKAEEVAIYRTSLRYGDSLKERLERVRKRKGKPDAEVNTELLIRLAETGLDYLEAVKGLLRAIESVRENVHDNAESNPELIRRLLLAGLESLKLQVSEK